MRIFQILFTLMRQCHKIIFNCSIMLLFSSSVLGQESVAENSLVTDRPDQTEASSTISKGVLQIESGGTYESFEDDFFEFNRKVESYTLNTTLIRYGILDNMELRLGWDFVEGVTTIDDEKIENVSSGFSPLLIGVKLGITEEKGALPEIALLLHVNHQFFAGNDYKTTSTGTDFRFSMSHTLNEKSGLGYNLGMSWDGNTTRETYLYTISYGYSITDNTGAYLELYGDIPGGLNFNHYWNTGLTYLVSNDLQLDTYIGTSITKGQDLLLGLGASFRLPN